MDGVCELSFAAFFEERIMAYAYYPGCSLKGSAKRLDRGIKKLFSTVGLVLKEIPDWYCCGAIEYGNAHEIKSMSRRNLQKASVISSTIVAPCPLCAKNLKESNENGEFYIYHPLDILDSNFLLSMSAKRDLKGRVFTPYYGCLLLRPKETAIKDKEVMERVIISYGGEIAGTEVKDRCCGGNKFFVNKELAFRLSNIILQKSRGTIVVFCPLCHMVLNTFSEDRRVVYFTDLILYVLGESRRL